jgi:hypothetical protein
MCVYLVRGFDEALRESLSLDEVCWLEIEKHLPLGGATELFLPFFVASSPPAFWRGT